MAKYRFFKKNKYSRKVEIRRERVEFDPWALIVCLAAAVLVWLYVAGTHLHNAELMNPVVTDPAETEAVTPAESDGTGGDEATDEPDESTGDAPVTEG